MKKLFIWTLAMLFLSLHCKTKHSEKPYALRGDSSLVADDSVRIGLLNDRTLYFYEGKDTLYMDLK